MNKRKLTKIHQEFFTRSQGRRIGLTRFKSASVLIFFSIAPLRHQDCFVCFKLLYLVGECDGRGGAYFKDLLCTNMQLQKHVSVASHSRYTEGLIQGDARQIDRMHR